MKIGNYQVEQQAVSQYERVDVAQDYVKTEVFEFQTFYYEDQIDISVEGMEQLEMAEEEEDYMTQEEKRKQELIETFLTFFLGRPFKFMQLGDLRRLAREAKQEEVKKIEDVEASEKETEEPKEVQEQKPVVRTFFGFRKTVVHREASYESEKMSFTSKGQVKTEDGQTIDFEVNLNMSREQYKATETISEFRDPLVINLDGQGVDFGDKKIKIDLDLDGEVDTFNFLSKGSGFLALDKNGNGKVDDGSELFGPQTNRGFDELRAYDVDGNEWIDENDDIFDQIKVWTVDGEGNEQLIGLKDAGVGAIYLGGVSSYYTLKHGDEDMAKITGSSIYLKENGQASTIHEVDIKI